jgi:hypothetical protein
MKELKLSLGVEQQALPWLFKDGHVVAPANLIDADADTDAVERASKIATEYDAELWKGAQLVRRLPAKRDGK